MIVVYCKHKLLSPAFDTVDHGYHFDGDGIRALRRIEALRSVCGDHFASIKMILDLTAALERLRADSIAVAREDYWPGGRGRSQSLNNSVSKNKREVQLSKEAEMNCIDA